MGDSELQIFDMYVEEGFNKGKRDRIFAKKDVGSKHEMIITHTISLIFKTEASITWCMKSFTHMGYGPFIGKYDE